MFTLVTDEIISKGYEFSEFKEWLETRKPGGGQLEAWTVSDIRTEIQHFCQKVRAGTSHSPQAGSPVKFHDETFNFDENDLPDAGFGEGRDISRFDLTHIQDIESASHTRSSKTNHAVPVQFKLERYVIYFSEPE